MSVVGSPEFSARLIAKEAGVDGQRAAAIAREMHNPHLTAQKRRAFIALIRECAETAYCHGLAELGFAPEGLGAGLRERLMSAYRDFIPQDILEEALPTGVFDGFRIIPDA